MTDDADTLTGSPGKTPSAEPGLLLGAGFDLSEIARLVLEATVPGFADGTGVFVLEQLLRGGEPVGQAADGLVVARRLGTGFARAGRGKYVSEAAFPAGEVVVFAADSSVAQCVHTGTPVIFGQPDGQTLERVPGDGRAVLSRYSSFLALPMTARDAVLGFVALAREPGKLAFGDNDAKAAAGLTARAGTTIASALSLLEQRTIADALQRGLLAATPPVPSRVEVSGRCVPAAGQRIGGDWYDVVPLPGDRTGLVVGDVMGHGPEAAALMAQLRAAAHALADLDLPPAELLGRLNRTAATLRHLSLATCAYAVIDPASQECTVAGAGHLPPVLALPDGTTRVPDLPAGQSIGLGTAVYDQARIELPPGAILALFTDGLVESRTRSFDQGIVALRKVLSAGYEYLETACGSLIATLADRYEDDVTVVLARIPPSRRLS